MQEPCHTDSTTINTIYIVHITCARGTSVPNDLDPGWGCDVLGLKNIRLSSDESRYRSLGEMLLSQSRLGAIRCKSTRKETAEMLWKNKK